MTEQTSKDLKDIVIARLETLPKNMKMSIGSYGDFNREQLIDHVKKGDAIGKKIIEIELEFLQAMKEGNLTV